MQRKRLNTGFGNRGIDVRSNATQILQTQKEKRKHSSVTRPVTLVGAVQH